MTAITQRYRRVRRLRRPRTAHDEVGTQGPLSLLRYFGSRFLGARRITPGRPAAAGRALRPLGITRLVIKYSEIPSDNEPPLRKDRRRDCAQGAIDPA
jgi:hypothetical protein